LIPALTQNQSLAADASGDGTLSLADASSIARIAAGLDTHVPAGANVGSDWFMVPVPAPAPNQTVVSPAPALSINGSIAYSPLAATAAGQDYLTGLFGDVSANWVTVAPLVPQYGSGFKAIEALSRRRSRTPALLSVLPLPAPRPDAVAVAIRLDGASRAISFDLELGFDPADMAVESIRAGGIAGTFTVTSNTSQPGRVRISMFSAKAIGRPGQLVVVTFKDLSGSRRLAAVSLGGFIDEGLLPAAILNGAVRLGRQR